MDSLSSSSFISTLSQHPKLALLSPNTTSTPSSSHHLHNILKISCVRIQENPQNITSRVKPPLIKTNPSSNTPLKPTPDSPLPRKIAPSRNPVVERPASFQFPAVIFNAFDNFIDSFIDPPLRRSIDPRYVLRDNFAPVDELPPTECEVLEGSLPSCLDGAYIRNGSNPRYLPRGPYHLFDGDGMLHSIRISQGKATFCSRYVKTYKYMVETEAGSPVLPGIFSDFNGLVPLAARGAVSLARVITRQYDIRNGFGLANTSLSLCGGNLFAHCETDLPYAVKLAPDGDVITLGRHDFGGKLFGSMTAHPKIDPITGEAFAFRYGVTPPFLTYFVIDPKGNKSPDVPIFSVRSQSFLHDFAITKKYAIFADIQIGMNPIEYVTSGSPVGTDSRKISRIGVIPRYATDESKMRWFDVPGFNILHAMNAWEEDDDGDTIVMVASNVLSVDQSLKKMDLIHSSIEKVKIDLKTGTVSRHPVSTRSLEFGVINLAYIGKKNRYVYASVGNPLPRITRVVKLDVSILENDQRDCIVAERSFGPGWFSSEPFFVAKEPNNPTAHEDDGYLVSYVHNETTGESRFLVMDATSPDLETVTVVKLPNRVPYGFHGIFVKESDLDKL